jgi:hypothetical protein
MKSLWIWLVLILSVTGLSMGGEKGWAADWKQFAEATTGVFRYDAASISSRSGGPVRVWINNMTKNETNLVELNCKERTYQVLSVVQWDEAFRIKSREDYTDSPNPNWLKISPESVPEALRKIVCP